jgi:RNA polymerase primary sigma factor
VALAQVGNQAAKAALIKVNMRFIMGIARTYQHQGMDLDDLYQEGCIGILRAIEKFDPEVGTKFLTYASWWIKQAILQSLGENTRHIRLPANRVNILEQVRKTKSHMSQSLQREPTEQEILREMDIDEAEVCNQYSISYHGPIQEGNTGHTLIVDTLANGEIPPPDYALMKEAFKKEFEMVLNRLEVREIKILKMLYGIDYERCHTLEEVGDALDLTRERVRQIKMRALKSLRRHDRRKHLEGLKN